MKSIERTAATELRRQGFSMNEIVTKVGVSKSSISLWVRNIELTHAQRKTLSQNGIRKDVIERRRNTRLQNEGARRQIIIDQAKSEIHKLLEKEIWLMGVMLYWAEGGKTMRGLVRFSNGDPEMIKFMMHFFRKICKVPENKFRGHIHIHPHLSTKNAEKFWSKISKIPLLQFYKTYNKPNKASNPLHKRDSLPNGTFDIYVCSTELFLKICGWSQGVFTKY